VMRRHHERCGRARSPWRSRTVEDNAGRRPVRSTPGYPGRRCDVYPSRRCSEEGRGTGQRVYRWATSRRRRHEVGHVVTMWPRGGRQRTSTPASTGCGNGSGHRPEHRPTDGRAAMSGGDHDPPPTPPPPPPPHPPPPPKVEAPGTRFAYNAIPAAAASNTRQDQKGHHESWPSTGTRHVKLRVMAVVQPLCCCRLEKDGC